MAVLFSAVSSLLAAPGGDGESAELSENICSFLLRLDGLLEHQLLGCVVLDRQRQIGYAGMPAGKVGRICVIIEELNGQLVVWIVVSHAVELSGIKKQI